MASMRTWMLSALLLLGGVAGVSAQEAAPSNSSDEVARGLFQAGRASYDAGNYEDALKYFQQAYDLSQRTELLYNLGQAADRLHRDAKTIEVFRLYLERVPDAPNRAEIEGRLRALERIVALEAAGAQQRDQDSAPPVTPAAQPETAPTDTNNPVAAQDESASPGIAPWLVIGGSGALLVTGVVLTIIGTGQISDVENAPMPSDWSAFSGRADSGPVLATTGVVLMTLGAAGAAVGVMWLLGSSDDQAGTTVAIGPGSIVMAGTL